MGGKRERGASEGSDYNDLGARCIYVGNLAWSVNWYNLKDFFNENVGEVEHAECLEYQDGRKTGSGIVKFKKADDAAKAIAEFNDSELHGRLMFIREDKENGKGPGSKGAKGSGKGKLPDYLAEKQVFVGNLSWNTNWQSLKDHMGYYGEIEYCDVMVDSSGERLGWGLVRYANKKDASKAVKDCHESWLDGRYIYAKEDDKGLKIDGESKKKQDWDSWYDYDYDYDYAPKKKTSKGKGKDAKGKGKDAKGKGKKGKGKGKGSDDDDDDEDRKGKGKKGKKGKGKKGKGKGDDSESDEE